MTTEPTNPATEQTASGEVGTTCPHCGDHTAKQYAGDVECRKCGRIFNAPAREGVREDDDSNVCEHGDHYAPPGERFCSKGCGDCEGTLDFEDRAKECANICGRENLDEALERWWHDEQARDDQHAQIVKLVRERKFAAEVLSILQRRINGSGR